MEDRVTTLSQKLKTLIGQYHFSSFIAHFCFLSNGHWRQQTGIVKLRSPVRQLIYLMNLHHSTGFCGQKLFFVASSDYDRIIDLLNEIEQCYGFTAEWLIKNKISKEDATRLFVTNTTFLNYYLNAPLSFFEQDIERIKETFKHVEQEIVEATGLTIQDFVNFFSLITRVEMEVYGNHFQYTDMTTEEHALARKSIQRPKTMTADERLALSDVGERRIRETGIPISRLTEQMDSDKVKMMLALFTLFREESDYLYYTETCTYLAKPIVMIDAEHIAMIYSKQLITAIYDFLFELCWDEKDQGAKVRKRREDYLEFKTEEVYRLFFGNNARIITNYYIGSNEKDLLILEGKNAYVIECKANKYRIPFRDPIKAYERIRDDFDKSIGKGYTQANEVEELFYGGQPFPIKNKAGKVLEMIDVEHFENIFNIVVTQERFGQIQCDLSYLLGIEEGKDYPWSVAIDDLETFLIALKRKKDHLSELPEFLLAREQLQGRVLCYDELELCSYFMFERAGFLRKCYRKEPLLSSSDMHLAFDNLYTAGYGFKDELYLAEKLKCKPPIAVAFIKRFKLAVPDRVRDFLNGSK